MPSFAETLVLVPLFVECAKCKKLLEVDTYSHPYIRVRTDHECKPEERRVADVRDKSRY